ncbi:hypothetical protein NDU88_001518, partial [Pleurodeles waltl]
VYQSLWDSLKDTVVGVKGDFQPHFPLTRQRKQKGHMRNMATTPTSVRRFHWTDRSQIIDQ